MLMKKSLVFTTLLLIVICLHTSAQSQTRIVKKGTKYDTIIVKHGPKPAKKPAAKPAIKPAPAVVVETVLPTPEFINQPYYYDNDGN